MNRHHLAASFLLCAVGSAALAGPVAPLPDVAPPQPPTPAPTPTDLERALERVVYPLLDGVSLTTALQYFRARSNLCVVVDTAVRQQAETARVSLGVPGKGDDTSNATEGSTLREALESAIEQAGLTYEVDRDAVFISTPERLAEIRQRERPLDPETLPDKLKQPFSCVLEGEPLPASLDLIARTTGVTIVIDQRERFELERATVDLRLTGPSVAQTLRFLLRQHELDFELVGEGIFVARPETLRGGASLGTTDDLVRAAKLDRRVSYAAIDTPLTEVLEALTKAGGVQLSYSSPPDRRPPRVTFEVNDLRMADVLDLLFRATRMDAAWKAGAAGHTLSFSERR